MKILLFFLLTVNLCFAQNSYFIQQNADKSIADGSRKTPYDSLSICLQNHSLSTGDTLYFLEGEYTEEITSLPKGVVLAGFDGDNDGKTGTVLSGLTNIPPHNIQAWTLEESLTNGVVYKTNLGSILGSGNHIWQLFVERPSTDGTALQEWTMARWPNALHQYHYGNNMDDAGLFKQLKYLSKEGSPYVNSPFNKITMAHTVDYTNHNGKWVDNPDKLNWGNKIINDTRDPASITNKYDAKYNGIIHDLSQVNSSLQDAMLVINSGSYKTYATPVSSKTGNEVIFDDTNMGVSPTHEYWYFLECHRDLIDIPGEWYYNKTTQDLYVAVEKVSDLENVRIAGKTNSYSIDLNSVENVTIQNIDFLGTTFQLSKCKNVTIKNCRFAWPNCSPRMLKDRSVPSVTSISNGDQCTIENCLFEYTDAEAFKISGNNHNVINNFFHHIDYSVANLSGLGLTFYAKSASNLTYKNNFFRLGGASATLQPGSSTDVSFNDMAVGGILQNDGSLIQMTNAMVPNSNVHHNWLHDSRAYGYRIDAPGGECQKAGDGAMVHHNVIYRTSGLMVKGDHQNVFNNTVFECNGNEIRVLHEVQSGSGINCSDKIWGCSEATYVKNNLASIIANDRKKVIHKLKKDCLNEDSIFVLLPVNANNPNYYSNNWNGLEEDTAMQNILADWGWVKNNFSKAKDSTYAKALAIDDVVKGLMINPDNFDFRPASNKLIGKGETDYSNAYLNQAITEATSDIGAYQANETAWKAGITWENELDFYPWGEAREAFVTNVNAKNPNQNIILSKSENNFFSTTSIKSDIFYFVIKLESTLNENSIKNLGIDKIAQLNSSSSEGFEIAKAEHWWNKNNYSNIISGKKIIVVEVTYNGTEIDSNLEIKLNPTGKINVGNKPLYPSEISLPVHLLLTNLEPKRKTLDLYPNPTNGLLHLKGISNSKVEIMSLDGQTLSTLQPRGEYINVSSLPNGIYLIKYSNKGITNYARFIKQN